MKTQDILNSKIMRAYKILERIDFIMDMKLNGYSCLLYTSDAADD